MGHHTIMRFWKANRSRGICSIMLALLSWAAFSVVVYFVGDGSSYLADVLILCGIQLALMIWPMIEYLWFFHRVSSMHDRYKWYIWAVAMTVVSLIVIFTIDGYLSHVGLETILSIVQVLLVIFIPRLVWTPA